MLSQSIDSASLQTLSKRALLTGFANLVRGDREHTAQMLAYIGEIDRRKLYLEQAYPSMFAFCTGRFRMSESIASKRIRAGRVASRFPSVVPMIARGELHLTGLHQLAAHLTDENYRSVLERAMGRSSREIEQLVAEIAPRPDVAPSIRRLPTPVAAVNGETPSDSPSFVTGRTPSPAEGIGSGSIPALGRNAAEETSAVDGESKFGEGAAALVAGSALRNQRAVGAVEPISTGQLSAVAPAVSHGEGGRIGARPGSGSPPFGPRAGSVSPLSPGRYRLQVTIGQASRDRLDELRGLLSHQFPDGDLSAIVEHALEALLRQCRKKKGALVRRPRGSAKGAARSSRSRAIPARVRRKVFQRDQGKCAFRAANGRRCGSTWMVEFHHKVPFARGGRHSAANIELRCRAHNQYEGELEFGSEAMSRRGRGPPRK